MAADITIYDANGAEVFNSDDGPGRGEQFLADHPGQSFRIVVRNSVKGVTFNGEMTAVKDEPPA